MVAGHCNSFAVLTTLHFFNISAWCLNHFHFNALQHPLPQLKVLHRHSPSAHFLNKASSWDYTIPWVSSLLWLCEFSLLGDGWGGGGGRKSANSLNIAKKKMLSYVILCLLIKCHFQLFFSDHHFLLLATFFRSCWPLPTPKCSASCILFFVPHVCRNIFSFASAWERRLTGCSFYCPYNHRACFMFLKGQLSEIRLLCCKAWNPISFYT